VIVPVRNGAETLPACLRALIGREGTELIVVDDASSDGSFLIGEAFATRVIRLPRRRGPGGARNAGARLARASILVFVDADVAVHADALDRICRTLAERPAVTAMFGAYDDRPRVTSTVGRYRNLLHHFFHLRAAGKAETFWTGLGAIRAEPFGVLGGFSEETWCDGIEDIELGRRLVASGGTIVVDRDLLGTHMKDWSFGSMVATDFLKRALPWSRLILAERSMPAGLNASTDQRVSAVLALLELACLPLVFRHPAFALGSALCAALVFAVNRPLFALFRRLHGAGFMMRCIPLHLVYLSVATAGFGTALALHHVHRLARRRAIAPVAETTIS
jgi:glycosyltransferase involved in cell wall biosynthesis